MEEQQKTIAKVQHYYDILLKEINTISEQAIRENDFFQRQSLSKAAEILSKQAQEYKKLFENFIYE